jgi:hypothetical protein
MCIRGMESGRTAIMGTSRAGGWSRRTFAVGRLTRRSVEILLAEGERTPPGPFVLKAIVTAPGHAN